MTALSVCVGLTVSFAAAALIARALIPVFKKKNFTRSPLVERGEALTPGEPAALFGVIPLTLGFLAGGLAGPIVSGMSGMLPVTAFRLFGGMIFALLAALAGGLDDWRAFRGGSVHPIVTFALYAVIVRFYTALLTAGGDRSDILVLPFFGQADLGVAYDILCFLLLLGSCYGGGVRTEAEDMAATSALIAGFSLAAAGGILKSVPAAVIGASLAGCALGGLIFGFPPAKIFWGRGGCVLFGAASAAAAMGCGVPALLIPAALPLFFEGVYALARLIVFAFAGKECPMSFSGWLCSTGLSYRAVSLINLIISLAGAVLTVFSAAKI